MTYRYLAFLSYSRADEAIVAQFHKILEKIRLPQDILASNSFVREFFAQSRHFSPVFRDKDELNPSSSLQRTLEQKLEESAYLIVMCSPDSAASHWVGKEIQYFRRLGRADRIILVLVRGQHALHSPQNPEGAIHPLTVERPDDLPLLADLTKAGGGLNIEAIKVAASALGVGFDLLFDRVRRARRRERIVQGAVLAALLIPLGIGLFQYRQSAIRASNVAIEADLLRQQEARERAAAEVIAQLERPRRNKRRSSELRSRPSGI